MDIQRTVWQEQIDRVREAEERLRKTSIAANPTPSVVFNDIRYRENFLLRKAYNVGICV